MNLLSSTLGFLNSLGSCSTPSGGAIAKKGGYAIRSGLFPLNNFLAAFTLVGAFCRWFCGFTLFFFDADPRVCAHKLLKSARPSEKVLQRFMSFFPAKA